MRNEVNVLNDGSPSLEISGTKCAKFRTKVEIKDVLTFLPELLALDSGGRR
jgi:hypothetical protein